MPEDHLVVDKNEINNTQIGIIIISSEKVKDATNVLKKKRKSNQLKSNALSKKRNQGKSNAPNDKGKESTATTKRKCL